MGGLPRGAGRCLSARGAPGLAVAALIVLGCKRAPERGREAVDAVPASASVSAAPRAVPSVPFDRHPAWRAAMETPDDDLVLARLADAEGAMGLLRGVDEGGAPRRVAFLALPHAEDAEAALAHLAGLALRIPDHELGGLEDAVQGIVQRRRRQVEPAHAAGLRAAYEAMATLASRDALSAPLRAKAVTTARLVADRAGFAPTGLPTAFD